MKQLAEMIPIAFFFITYKMSGTEIQLGSFNYTLDGIFSATAVLIAATTMQLVLTKLLTGAIEKRLWWLFFAVVVFGSATLIFRNQVFIQWKPTIFNWVLGIVFLVPQLMGKKMILERAIGQQLTLPHPIWVRLNIVWIIYFFATGALNLFVAYNFTESFWVSYKLYSAIGFTLLISIITAFIVSPHITEENIQKD